jgi:integrase
MGTIRFEPRTDKANKQGKVPFLIIYQISGQRIRITSKLKCLPANWHADSQQAIYIDKRTAKKIAPSVDYTIFLCESAVKEFNSKIEAYKTDIANIEKRFSLDKEVYDPINVKEALTKIYKPESKKREPGKSVIDFIAQFVKDSSGHRKPGTLKVYSGLANHIEAFEKAKKIKLTFDALNIPLLKSLYGFLTGTQGMNNITAAKQMSTLKTLLNYARTEYKIAVNQDYRDYKVSRKDGNFEVITLTNDEFETLYNLDLSGNKRLDQVRDVFCFSCATGLRFSDLYQLKREHIKSNTIKMTAAKTGQLLEIPLNPFSASIIEKYKGMHKPLPVISNQKTNDYLKELCKLTGIDSPIEVVREFGVKKETAIYKKYELISIHVGRKTFATLSLEKGIAPQEVMAITGHTTYKAFKRYVDVTSKRKQTVMAQAWGTVKDKNLKAV